MGIFFGKDTSLVIEIDNKERKMKKLTSIILCIYLFIDLTPCFARDKNNYSSYIKDLKIEKLSDCLFAYKLATMMNTINDYNIPAFLGDYGPSEEFEKNFLGYMMAIDIKINNISSADAVNHVTQIHDKKTSKKIEEIHKIISSNNTYIDKRKEIIYFMNHTILHCVKDYDAAYDLDVIHKTYKK